jgi:iron complex outermembrane receptor protein
MNNQFTFPKGWGGEISGWYRTKGVEGQVVVQPLGAAAVAVSKKIMKEKATLKLSMNDIFLTNKPNGYINFQQTEATFRNSRDSRTVSMTFSWRFGKPLKGTAPRRHSGGAGEESNRVKSGGNGN